MQDTDLGDALIAAISKKKILLSILKYSFLSWVLSLKCISGGEHLSRQELCICNLT